MLVRFIFSFAVVFITFTPHISNSREMVPENVTPALDYVFSLFTPNSVLETDKLAELISLVSATPEDSSMTLPNKKDAEGAFYTFQIQGSLSHILDYAYNPDVPAYITMPSSVQNLEWVIPQSDEELRNLLTAAKSAKESRLIRGKEQEVITPDTNTGGYYSYSQDRIIASFPGTHGPVFISATIQNDKSEVGRKGCIIGEDSNWNYLYSDETGLNKTGLGWADSYLYSAHSVIVYIADSTKNIVYVGSFKWLNAGWAGINMVNSGHILKGIKRFASDFKTVLEAPGLPDAAELAAKHDELAQMSTPELQNKVSTYLETLNDSGSMDNCPGKLRRKVSSGEYLEKMSQKEMIRIVLLEYVKDRIGKEEQASVAALTN